MLEIFKRPFSKQEPIFTTIPKEDHFSLEEVKQPKRHISNVRANKLFIRGDKMINRYLNIDSKNLFIEAPLYVKLNFVIHALNITNITLDNEVNWNGINGFLFDNSIEFDYNVGLPDNFVSIRELSYFNSLIFMALQDIEPYYESKCKTCNNTFSLKYGEIKFYIENNLYVPRKCSVCRKSK